MSIIRIFIQAVAGLVNFILNGYMIILLARAVISWVSPDPYNPIVRFLHNVTEPVLYRVRKMLPFTYTSGIDFSPLLVMLVIIFLQDFLVKTLYHIANSVG
ncbi:MAG: YggT family protein [Proteobacteria bacterium]|nr:YggT family protein [Pseudomonadota bacterium]MBU1641217.1 YggT family protein [Pseudomonadota bacterium]